MSRVTKANPLPSPAPIPLPFPLPAAAAANPAVPREATDRNGASTAQRQPKDEVGARTVLLDNTRQRIQPIEEVIEAAAGPAPPLLGRKLADDNKANAI